MRRVGGTWSSVLLVALLVAACSRAPRVAADASVAAATSPDSATGRVVRLGPDPVGWWALTTADGAQIRLSGDATLALCAVVGASVQLRGVRARDAFQVTAFVVQMVNDQPVDDGVIVVSAGGVALRLADGSERAVPNASADLRRQDGRRVWVTRPVAGVAPSYGVIAAACK
jgi:hypothetical protein